MGPEQSSSNSSKSRGAQEEDTSRMLVEGDEEVSPEAAMEAREEFTGDGAEARTGASGEGATGEVASEGPLERPIDEIAALRAERDSLFDQLLRSRADYDNSRKRSAREWQDFRKKATAEILRDLLELVDNLERALQAADEENEGLRKGVELIHQQLLTTLRKYGIDALEAQGQLFDPSKHEAVLMVDSDEVESQHVVDVVQRGYLLHGDVLRPARVTVSR